MRVYAKINLAINNLGKKGSMHELDMIVGEVSLYDEVTISVNESSQIEINGMDIPLEKNLMYKAAKKFLEYNGINKGVTINIEKHIPEEAGLGGGSADAACVLKLMNEIFKTSNSVEELTSIAIPLGSDVPFFLYGGICRVKGFGEVVTKISDQRINNVTIIKPRYGLSTKDVFEESDLFGAEVKTDALDTIEREIRNGIIPWEKLFNDLEFPADNISKSKGISISEYKSILLENGAKVSLMSGSGSSIFCVGEIEGEKLKNKYAVDIWQL